MNKVIDLSDCRINETLWSVEFGKVRFRGVYSGEYIFSNGDRYVRGFKLNGKNSSYSVHPTLFHSFEEFCEYHGVERIKSKKEIIKDHYADILNEAKAKKENEGE